MQKIKNRTEKRCDFLSDFYGGEGRALFFWDYPLAISVRICYIIYNCFVIWERCAEKRAHAYIQGGRGARAFAASKRNA